MSYLALLDAILLSTHVVPSRIKCNCVRQLFRARPPVVLCADRWDVGKRRRSSDKLADVSESESGSEAGDDGPSSKFVPFGSVIAASGSTVRVSVSCAAGLAAQLPIWGMKLRGDADFKVRALRPEDAIVLREGAFNRAAHCVRPRAFRWQE